eukprot:5241071-Pleurochrysis_carterae.AAC.3
MKLYLQYHHVAVARFPNLGALQARPPSIIHVCRFSALGSHAIKMNCRPLEIKLLTDAVHGVQNCRTTAGSLNTHFVMGGTSACKHVKQTACACSNAVFAWARAAVSESKGEAPSPSACAGMRWDRCWDLHQRIEREL